MDKFIGAIIKGLAESFAPWIILWAVFILLIGFGLGFFVAWLVL